MVSKEIKITILDATQNFPSQTVQSRCWGSPPTTLSCSICKLITSMIFLTINVPKILKQHFQLSKGKRCKKFLFSISAYTISLTSSNLNLRTWQVESFILPFYLRKNHQIMTHESPQDIYNIFLQNYLLTSLMF